MHELAIVKALLETIVPRAKESGAKKILEVNFRIGESPHRFIFDENFIAATS